MEELFKTIGLIIGTIVALIIVLFPLIGMLYACFESTKGLW